MTVTLPLVVAQVTDIHLFANAKQQLLGLPTIESFQAILKQLELLEPRPDLLLLTGDLSQDGKPESYEKLQTLLDSLGIPTYWLPGNHDCPPVMQAVLNSEFVLPQRSFRVGGWQFLLLSSHVAGCVHGWLSPESLDWLDRELSTIGDTPALVALHHPPFQVGSDWLDGSALQNAADLFRVLERHDRVKLVLFGHIHQEYEQCYRGVQYFGTPSTSIQFEPHSHSFSLDQEHPGFRILHLYPDGTWWTVVERSTYSHELDLVTKGY